MRLRRRAPADALCETLPALRPPIHGGLHRTLGPSFLGTRAGRRRRPAVQSLGDELRRSPRHGRLRLREEAAEAEEGEEEGEKGPEDAQCRALGTIAPGATRRTELNVWARRRARGAYKLRFVVRGGGGAKPVTRKLITKKHKNKKHRRRGK
jgi:hypothetical protein